MRVATVPRTAVATTRAEPASLPIQRRRFGGTAPEGKVRHRDGAPLLFSVFRSSPKTMAEITAKLVKDLRDKTGAGMMDCKKALAESGGDMTKAAEWLRQKGIATAEKKAGRTAAEGAVGSYIHTGARVGVLVEVNCETDFVARGELFQELVRNVAMQIAACPNVEYVTTDQIPQDVVEREKAIEMGRDDLDGKKEEMKVKIVEGRIGKRLKELALLEQPFIRDNTLTVGEMVKQAAGKTGENIQVRRFSRFTLGEGIEVEQTDFAAEVAAMGKAA